MSRELLVEKFRKSACTKMAECAEEHEFLNFSKDVWISQKADIYIYIYLPLEKFGHVHIPAF